jgi:hypothetical protein
MSSVRPKVGPGELRCLGKDNGTGYRIRIAMPRYDVLLRGGLHAKSLVITSLADRAGPSETPPIKKVFRSTTDFFVAAGRTQLFNPGDMDNVIKARSDPKTENHSLPNPWWSSLAWDATDQA